MNPFICPEGMVEELSGRIQSLNVVLYIGLSGCQQIEIAYSITIEAYRQLKSFFMNPRVSEQTKLRVSKAVVRSKWTYSLLF